MTSVYIYGSIKHLDSEKEKVYLEVERGYKDKNGVINKDLIPCKYWSKNTKNILFKLKDGTKLIVKGRLEKEDEVLVIIEEFCPF